MIHNFDFERECRKISPIVPHRNGWLDRDAVYTGDSWVINAHCIRWRTAREGDPMRPSPNYSGHLFLFVNNNIHTFIKLEQATCKAQKLSAQPSLNDVHWATKKLRGNGNCTILDIAQTTQHASSIMQLPLPCSFVSIFWAPVFNDSAAWQCIVTTCSICSFHSMLYCYISILSLSGD